MTLSIKRVIYKIKITSPSSFITNAQNFNGNKPTTTKTYTRSLYIYATLLNTRWNTLKHMLCTLSH